MRYVRVAERRAGHELFNQATVFVQTSTHEGFCLPPLEAMATGGAVVCTDAHGNRDFCVDGENCLMPEPDRERLSAPRSRGCSPTPSCASGWARAGDRDGRRVRLGAADRRARGVPGGASRARRSSISTSDRGCPKARRRRARLRVRRDSGARS